MPDPKRIVISDALEQRKPRRSLSLDQQRGGSCRLSQADHRYVNKEGQSRPVSHGSRRAKFGPVWTQNQVEAAGIETSTSTILHVRDGHRNRGRTSRRISSYRSSRSTRNSSTSANGWQRFQKPWLVDRSHARTSLRQGAQTKPRLRHNTARLPKHRSSSVLGSGIDTCHAEPHVVALERGIARPLR